MEEAIRDLQKLADPARAFNSQWFFKTAPGEYGEDDVFMGLTVPNVRLVARKYRNLRTEALDKLLDNEFHEARQLALFVMVYQFQKKSSTNREELHRLYVKKARQGRVNNWDLVDLSAKYLIGQYLQDKDRQLIHDLSKSRKLWLERISILSTFYYLNDYDFEDSLILAEHFLKHEHDLIQKAIGWMLREIGNRDKSVEEGFLSRHYRDMPRTMLRYAIEKFPEFERQAYLKGTI